MTKNYELEKSNHKTSNLQRIPDALEACLRAFCLLLHQIFLFFVINLLETGDQIHVFGWNDSSLIYEFVTEPEDEKSWNRDVGPEDTLH